MTDQKLYAERDAAALDAAGNYYSKHVSAMTAEDLHAKSAIAAELGHRDAVIDELSHKAGTLDRFIELLQDREKNGGNEYVQSVASSMLDLVGTIQREIDGAFEPVEGDDNENL